jgi:hypothetical protein
MTDPEDFLSRWARRKRDAKSEAETAGKPSLTREPPADARVPGAPQASLPSQTSLPSEVNLQAQADPQTDESKSGDPFDLSQLPSLDSIGPATDMRVFMQPGVPQALSRAALRRAWLADPEIRDFIGLAENAWDFTASDDMHGFGALDPADAKRLLAQFFSESDRKDEKKGQDALPGTPSQDAISDVETPRDEASDPDLSDNAGDEALASDPVPDQDREMLLPGSPEPVTASVASQHKLAKPARALSPEPAPEPARVFRSRGRALPQ